MLYTTLKQFEVKNHSLMVVCELIPAFSIPSYGAQPLFSISYSSYNKVLSAKGWLIDNGVISRVSLSNATTKLLDFWASWRGGRKVNFVAGMLLVFCYGSLSNKKGFCIKL